MTDDDFSEIRENYEIISKEAPFVYFILDEKGIFLVSRGKGLEKIGLKQDQIVGANVYDLYDEYPELLDALKIAYSGEKATHTSYVEESDLYWKTELYPIISDNSRKVLGISIDITDTIKTERQLERTQRLNLIGKLTAGVSHEFNNILTIFQGIGDLLALNGDLNDDQSIIVKSIYQNVERGRNLTKQLRTYSKESTEFSTKNTIFNINHLILNLVNLIDISQFGNNVTISINLRHEGEWIKSDDGKIHYVLVNLLLNAAEAIRGSGEITILTRTINLTKTNRQLEIKIVDSGSGIKNTEIEKIFDPFYTTKTHGLGLGLSTARSIIKHLDGNLKVESELGMGSTFIITIPQTEITTASSPSKSKMQTTKFDLESSKVLVIEDEVSIRNYLKTLIVKNNGVVTAFANGKEAYDYIVAGNKVDLVLSDFKMDKMTGLELYKKIKKNNKLVHLSNRFILITGYLESLTHNEKNLVVLKKPFQTRELFNTIKELNED